MAVKLKGLFRLGDGVLSKGKSFYRKVRDGKDSRLNDNGRDRRPHITERRYQKEDQRQPYDGHHDMDPGIDVCLAANEQELYAEGIGTDKKYGDEQKPQRKDRIRIIPAADSSHDQMREDKDQGQLDHGYHDGDLLDLLHDLKRLDPVFMEYFAEAREDRLGKRRQRECLNETGYLFGDGIESRDRIIGQKTNGKNARRCISIDRHDRNKNIPAGLQLLTDTAISFEFKSDPESSKNRVLPPEADDQRDAGGDERDHEVVLRPLDK